MQTYKPPTREMRFLLEALGYDEVSSLDAFSDFDIDTAQALIEQLGAFAVDKIMPTDKVGDQQGLKWDAETGDVTTPDGYKELFAEFAANGFVGMAANPEFGGGGAPEMIAVPAGEMLSSCNHAWAMCTGLTGGLIRALDQHGSDQQKQDYLEKLISGEWTGTMCLTEPQCGTDLGLISTKAEPKGDAYSLTGTKIWISFGEHDMAENIVHLVLARLPDAPPGIKGISTFIVPKFTLDGKRNGIKCTGLEHKMGIHGSPTCVMDMEEAEGYLVGTPHKGMRVMFTMMNAARLHVGVEGLAGAEISYQTAVAFAQERKQSRSLDPKKRDESSAADGILVHPDVRRMLLNQKATNEAMRALSVWVAKQLDLEHAHPDEQVRQEAGDLAALLTPVVKAYLTERGCQNISEAMQACGGSGYTEDWHIEQFYRDARITMIYEGTNHIQALDLVGRKLPMNGGRAPQLFAARIGAYLEESADEEKLQPFNRALREVSEVLSKTTMSLLGRAMEDAEEVGAAANNYLKLFGLTALSFMWCLQARHALNDDSAYGKTKLRTAQYFFDQVLPEYHGLLPMIEAGKAAMMAFDESDFETP
jgi:alkylation response protein AidB-like acyl-CoA dehydrogenase